jgi:hypothetical protein
MCRLDDTFPFCDCEVYRKLGQVTQLMCWFLVVLFWRSLALLSNPESSFQLQHNGIVIYISMGVFAVITLVPTAIAASDIYPLTMMMIVNFILACVAFLFIWGTHNCIMLILTTILLLP